MRASPPPSPVSVRRPFGALECRREHPGHILERKGIPPERRPGPCPGVERARTPESPGWPPPDLTGPPGRDQPRVPPASRGPGLSQKHRPGPCALCTEGARAVGSQAPPGPLGRCCCPAFTPSADIHRIPCWARQWADALAFLAPECVQGDSHAPQKYRAAAFTLRQGGRGDGQLGGGAAEVRVRGLPGLPDLTRWEKTDELP